MFFFHFLQEREELLRKRLGKVKHCISDAQITKLSQKLSGRTGFDIKKIIENASKAPCLKVKKSKYFRRKPTPLLCLDPICPLWHVSSEQANDKVPKSSEIIKSLSRNDICDPSVTFDDVLIQIKRRPRTVTPESLDRYVEYGKSIEQPIREPFANQ